jgi:hypothetical protein
MAAILPPLETPEERLVFWMITGTWGLWLIGGLYHLFPLLGWALVALAVGRRVGVLQQHGRRPRALPWGAWAWLLGMGAMLVALVLAHLDYELGPGPPR